MAGQALVGYPEHAYTIKIVCGHNNATNTIYKITAVLCLQGGLKFNRDIQALGTLQPEP